MSDTVEPGSAGRGAEDLRDRLDVVVGAAARAVSIHNTQPWRFQLHHGALYVLGDRDRQLHAADPRGRELVVSCGAAVYNARLAMRTLGYALDVELLPALDAATGGPEGEVLARLSPSGRSEPTKEERRLFGAIPHRHTHRGAFSDAQVPRELLVALQEEAAAEGATLHLVERPGQRRALSKLVIEADRAQRGDPEVRAEVASWTVPPGERRPDGVPAHAYPAGPAGPGPEEFPVRDFSVGRGWGSAEPAEAGGEHHPIAVLTTAGDRPADWLVAGQALQRLLLLAATRWIFASLYSQPLELPDVRVLVRDEVDTADFPQMVLRLGHSAVSEATPRRPVADVLDDGTDRGTDRTDSGTDRGTPPSGVG